MTTPDNTDWLACGAVLILLALVLLAVALGAWGLWWLTGRLGV